MVTLSRIVGDSSCEGEKGGDVDDDDDDGDCGGDGEVEVEGDTVGGDGKVKGDIAGGEGDGDGDIAGGDGEEQGDIAGGDGKVEVSDISWSFLLLKLPFSSLLLMSLLLTLFGGIVPLFSPNM